ncbi:unnamed protein product [Urochloa decumbens]|uniref:Uncharacterized protein n=1 Tax=Urochloa decumbens TaxID=240449 RepID=A0ABC8WB64_9POAL
MATSRKLSAASHTAAKQALGLVPGPGDGALPWDVIQAKLAALLRFLASAALGLAAELRDHAGSLLDAVAAMARAVLAVAIPAAAVVVVLLVLCGCFVAAGQHGRRRRRGPDGEEVEGLGGDDGPVVSYRGVYKAGIFSMHPNKPIVC